MGVPGTLSAPIDGFGDVPLDELSESGLHGNGGRIGHGGHPWGTDESEVTCVPLGVHGILFASIVVVGLT